MFVRTVKGDLDPRSLGFTHCHDHLFVFEGQQTGLPEDLLLNSYDKTKSEVSRFIEKGGSCVLDAQPFGAGRHVSLLQALSNETKLHIITSTGLHKPDFYKSYFWSFDASPSQLVDLFVSEVEEGAYAYDYYDPFKKRSVVKAGALKVATDEKGFTEYSRKVFNAAVMAHKKTGAPILTHTELSKWGLEQAAYLTAAGIPGESVIICHMDRVLDINAHIEVAQRGVFLEYDTIGRYGYHSDEDEALLLKTMIQKGFRDQLLVGMDSTRQRYISYGGAIGLDFILCHFIPKLLHAGITLQDIEAIAVKNPQWALSFKKR